MAGQPESCPYCGAPTGQHLQDHLAVECEALDPLRPEPVLEELRQQRE